MTFKLDHDQLEAQIAATDGLLASLPANDFLGRVGLRARRKEIADRLGSMMNREDRRAKIALYFGGEPVIGSMGIEAEFGTNALGSFQDLISKVWGATDGCQLSATGPVKDKAASQLHITNLVHGSFGFMLEELDETGEPLFETELNKATDQVAQYITSFANEDERVFTELIEEMNPRVFQSIKQFFSYIYRGKATFRLVEGERDVSFDQIAIERAWRRADESNIDEDKINIEGLLLGVIPKRRRFEFEPDEQPKIIEGKVGEEFSQSYLDRISTEQFAGRRWRAMLQRRLIAKPGRMPSELYTLLKLEEIQPKAS
jgi:hypothetical protein